jgi:putative ABC transport system permease protein
MDPFGTRYHCAEDVDSFLQDVRFGLRILLRTPVITSAILLSLALGIGANTAMFSILDAVFLRPVRFADPANLTLLWEQPPEGGQGTVSAANFLDWRERSHSFAELAGWSPVTYVVTGGDHPEGILGAAVTANFFHALGARPVLGRTFLPGEDGIPKPTEASRVAVISYGMWQEILGGDPNVIGRMVRLNDVPYAVVGVMAPDFRFLGRRQSIWVPLTINRANRDYRYLTVIGRLNKPRTIAAAEMTTLARSLGEAYPKTNRGWSVEVDDFREWLANNFYRARLLLLAGALGLILLIACTNIASLLLTRSAARANELSLRVALGATPVRIVRQLLMESLLLAATGGILGMLLAWVFIQAAPAILPPAVVPTGVPLEMSPLVLLFTAAVSLATGALFGMVPAISANRIKIQETLKDSGRTSTSGGTQRWFRDGVVIFEVAVALVLVSAASLLIAGVRKLAQIDPGSRVDHVLTLRIFLPQGRYDASHALALHQQALKRVEALPGVESATIATNLPLQKVSMEVPFDLETAPPRTLEERPGIGYVGISPGYLQALGIPLRRGRMFTEADNSDAPPVVIVNEAFAARYFPNEDPVGKTLLLNRPILGKDNFEDTIHAEIVGVVGDVKPDNLNGPPVPILYGAHAQNVWSASSWLAIRSTVDPAGLTEAVRREMLELDKGLPVEQASSMEQIYLKQFAEPRFESQLMGAFAALALVLAGIGIYSVNAYSVSQRSREIAMRVALGASSRAILLNVLGRGLVLAFTGILAGVAGTFLASRLLKSMLVGVNADNPWTLAAAALILVLISAGACYLPARRAIRIDPSAALRQP